MHVLFVFSDANISHEGLVCSWYLVFYVNKLWSKYLTYQSVLVFIDKRGQVSFSDLMSVFCKVNQMRSPDLDFCLRIRIFDLEGRVRGNVLFWQNIFSLFWQNMFCSVLTEHFFQNLRNIGTFWNVPRNILMIIAKTKIAMLFSDLAGNTKLRGFFIENF